MNLTQLRQQLLGRKAALVIIFLLVIIVGIFFISIRKQKEYTIKTVPPPAQGQPVKDGKFDTEAEISKKSKAEVDKIKSKLPKREEFQTSTGTNVSYTIFYKPTDPNSLYIETTKINLQIPKNNTNFPKEVQNFRETAARAFDWLNNQGTKIDGVFIIWSDGVMQKAAETLFMESEEYPKVIKVGDMWEFEKASP